MFALYGRAQFALDGPRAKLPPGPDDPQEAGSPVTEVAASSAAQRWFFFFFCARAVEIESPDESGQGECACVSGWLYACLDQRVL